MGDLHAPSSLMRSGTAWGLLWVAAILVVFIIMLTAFVRLANAPPRPAQAAVQPTWLTPPLHAECAFDAAASEPRP